MPRGNIKYPYKPLVVRLTLVQYNLLRKESFTSRRPMSELVREAIDRWLQDDQTG